jgi:predicted DNA-binding transcriptional regulator YafY
MDGLAGRLFTLVDLLQSRGRLTVGQLATRLAVSERTIRRDLARLQSLDLPVEVTPGRHGGVRVRPGALLPPLRFTDNELLALVLGIKQLSRFGDTALEQASARALKRLETVLTETTRVRIEALSQALAADPATGAAGPKMESGRVLELAEAIHRQRRITLHYASTGSGATTRSVDPYGLVRLGHWYLAAYCHLRQDLRTFRLDRIRTFRVTQESFERPAEFDAFKVVTASIAQALSHGNII